jgi:hypothetical protein
MIYEVSQASRGLHKSTIIIHQSSIGRPDDNIDDFLKLGAGS